MKKKKKKKVCEPCNYYNYILTFVIGLISGVLISVLMMSFYFADLRESDPGGEKLMTFLGGEELFQSQYDESKKDLAPTTASDIPPIYSEQDELARLLAAAAEDEMYDIVQISEKDRPKYDIYPNDWYIPKNYYDVMLYAIGYDFDEYLECIGYDVLEEKIVEVGKEGAAKYGPWIQIHFRRAIQNFCKTPVDSFNTIDIELAINDLSYETKYNQLAYSFIKYIGPILDNMNDYLEIHHPTIVAPRRDTPPPAEYKENKTVPKKYTPPTDVPPGYVPPWYYPSKYIPVSHVTPKVQQSIKSIPRISDILSLR